MSHLTKLQSQLSGLQLSCEYWDVRVEDSFETTLTIVDGEIVSCSANPSAGAFVRIRKNGFWYSEATTELENIKNILQGLDRLPARSQGGSAYKAERHPAFTASVPLEHRFSKVPMALKIERVQKYEFLLRSMPHVASTQLRYKDIFKTKSFLNSAGTCFEFDFNQGGITVGYNLKKGTELFEDAYRMYASRFSDLDNHEEALRKHVEESALFLSAPAIDPGKYRVLLSPDVAGIFTHESFGHKSEADFMLGNDEAMAAWKLGKRIGAECLSIVDCGTHTNTSGYCPIDDDGTPAQKNYLIKNGLLTGRLHSRETAQQLGEKPTGNSRALGFEWEPIVRMTSTYIEPGSENLQSLLNRSEGALLVVGAKHGSGLSTFTIAPLRGYRILKNGQREPVRLAVISGSVFEALSNIEAVSSDFHLDSSAIGGCGKMDQAPLPVADGGPYVLVKEMQVS